MVSQRSQRAFLLGATLGLTNAVALPDPTAAPAKVQVSAPVVTAAVLRFDSTHSYVEKRNIFDQIQSDVDGIAKSWASVLGTDLPSLFTDGKYLPDSSADRLC